MNYKDTLNLPRTEFPMKANLPKREPEMLARWEEQGIYQAIQSERADAPRYILHDGPPFANGNVHVGTALNKILKDLIVKYKTMRGYCVPYVPGWDCHGQPIEFKVKKELGDTAATLTQAELRRRCRAYAESYIEIQREEFKRLGVFGDWEHPYLTMDREYEAEIIGTMAEMVGDGYIYRGKKPVYWCAQCQTALAEAEVEYADHRSPSIYVKFPLADRAEEYAVIWTTTPWTLPANLAIAVKAEFLYVRAETDNGETWLVAESLLEPVAAACGVELKPVEKLTGQQLEGRVARHPFVDREVPLILSPHVTLEQGTGLVHTAPGHGAEDYEVGQKYGLEVLAPVDDHGVFTAEAGQFAGQPVFAANAPIVQHLADTNRLAGHAEHDHSYPHCWRCKQPIIFRAMEQWFIALDHCGLRQNALAEVGQVDWVPAWGQNRIAGTIEQRPDWCVSRQRAWGVPLPFLHCEDCGESLVDRDLVLQFRERVLQDGVDVWFEKSVSDLFGDIACRGCGSRRLKQCPDIVDVWFESGVSHRAVLKQRAELGHPADLYLEGSDQHRGWFQSSLLTSMATEKHAPFKTVVTHGFLVVQVEETGKKQKISKSAGRPANSADYVEKLGADVLRLWVTSEDYQGDIPLSDEIFSRIGETYFKVRNTFRILLANLYDFEPARDAVPVKQLGELDRWLLVKLQGLLADLEKAYDAFSFHRVYHLVNAFCAVELSSFYVDVMKDLLYTLAPGSPQRRSAQTVMWQTADVLARVLAPVMPFTAEEVWQQLPARDTASVHLARFPTADAALEDPELVLRWERLLAVREQVAVALEAARRDKLIGKTLEARVTITPDSAELGSLLRELGSLLETVLIVSAVEIEERIADELAVRIDRVGGEKCIRCWRWTEDIGTEPSHPQICGRCAAVVGSVMEQQTS